MKILVLKEHHGNRYFDVSTQEKMDAVVLSIVRGRFGQYDSEYLFEGEPKRPFTDEEFATLLKTPMKEAARLQMQDYRDLLGFYCKHQQEQQRIADCLKNNDAKEAQRVLKSRKHCEDEDYDIVNVEDSY